MILDLIVLSISFTDADALAAPPIAAPIPADTATIFAFESVLTSTSPVVAVTIESSIEAVIVLLITLSETAALPATPPATAILPAKEIIFALLSYSESFNAFESVTLSGSSISSKSVTGRSSDALIFTVSPAVTVDSSIFAVILLPILLRVTDA